LRSNRFSSWLFAFLICAFAALIARCFYLQVINSGFYSSESINQRQKWVSEKPQRGVILDSTGRVLAASNRFQIIYAEPRSIKDKIDDVSARLSPVIKMSPLQISDIITGSKNPGYVKLKINATENECKGAAVIDGIGTESSWQRFYPAARLASTVIGFTSADNIGLEGLELKFNSELSGDEGENVFFADVMRRPIRLKEHTTYAANGYGLILTIDSTIQQFARAELEKTISDFQAESGVAIVAEPKTGAILAMVSLPDFDPQNMDSVEFDKIRNRAITDQFEPGSIFKPFVAAIAIDSNRLSTSEKIFCEYGSYHGKGFGTIGEYGNHRYGNLSVRDILSLSSNIGMAKIGQKLGAQRIYNGLRKFGFGQKTNIDLPGEVGGNLRPLNQWNGYSITRVAFGQEISATAIQLVQAFCIIANGGKFVSPYVVKAVVDNQGDIIKIHQSPKANQVIRPATARWLVRDALTAVVNEGTGKPAKIKKWQIFGKTGTAQMMLPDGKGYSDTDYFASFIAGAPAENPKIVVLVSVVKPNKKLGKGYTGGAVSSAPAARIIERTLTYYESRNP
jgi:cell division protein FtsI/penicillin-binding protein 2